MSEQRAMAFVCVACVSRDALRLDVFACVHILNWSLVRDAELLNLHPQQMDVASGDLTLVFERNVTKPGWRSVPPPSDRSIHKLLYWVYNPPTSHISFIQNNHKQMCKASQRPTTAFKKKARCCQV